MHAHLPASAAPITIAPQSIVGDADAFSVDQFCKRHGICRAHFYNLAKAGRAPRIMKVGSRTLISREAAAEWRRQMEADAALNA
jgi:predicted DNA-binding transcriptional regulator AlpA